MPKNNQKNSSSSKKKEFVVIEIGSGYGTLTELLVKTLNCPVFSFEIDRILFEWLNKRDDLSEVTFIKQDALKVDWPAFIKQFCLQKKVTVVGNLPFVISNRLLLNLLLSDTSFFSFFFLIQQEVAERWVAQKGEKNYSALSVLIRFLTVIKKISAVPKTVFTPQPKVTGALVSLIIKKNKSLTQKNKKNFWVFLNNCFKYPRKKLLNNLSFFNSFICWEEFFLKKKLSFLVRPSDFFLNHFWDLFNFFCQKSKKIINKQINDS